MLIQTDIALFLKINALFSGKYATLFFTNITHFGNGLVLAMLVLPALYFLKHRDFKIHAISLVLAVAVSGGVVNIMKPIINRDRPGPHLESLGVPVHIPGGTPSDKSFPSGHTQTAVGTGVYLSLVYPMLSPVFLILAALVGLSRIALGVHYPLDVAVGALFGCIASVVAFHIAQKRARTGLTPPSQNAGSQ